MLFTKYVCRNDQEAARRRTKTKPSSNDPLSFQATSKTDTNTTPQGKTQLIEAETAEEGRVTRHFIKTYIPFFHGVK